MSTISDALQLFSFALIGSLIALAGGIIFLYKRSWSQVLANNSIPFAAGVLITVSLLGLLPEAYEMMGENVFGVLLAAFFSAYFFEHFLFGIHHHEDDHHGHDYKSAVPLVIVGDTIHNFIDGVAIGAGFLINPGLGFVTAVSTFLHEVPHEMGDFGILLKAGWSRKNIIVVNFLSASTTILGAFSIYLFSGNETFIGALLGVAAGIFLYLGAIDFLPHIQDNQKSRVKAIAPLLLGIFLMALTLVAVPHSHEHEEEGHAIETSLPLQTD